MYTYVEMSLEVKERLGLSLDELVKMYNGALRGSNKVIKSVQANGTNRLEFTTTTKKASMHYLNFGEFLVGAIKKAINEKEGE